MTSVSIGAKGGLQPAPALWNGIREGEGKGTSPNRGPTGPSPPQRAPAAGAEFRIRGCALPSQSETVHSKVVLFH